ncbi:hypothetical protein [Streptomyces sp. NPDC047999]|uniref:hypothetical protein n=2 Tax=unclassified Streptomyces TaxID=2593676 RepID=UPI0037137206
MSRMLFVLRFRCGEPEPLDLDAVREVLGPYAVGGAADPLEGLLIRTADGREVEVDVNELCIGVARFPPGHFFDLLAALVDRLGASVLPCDRPALLRAEADRSHLPGPAREEAVVVPMTGRAVESFLSGGSWRPAP